MRTYKYRLYPTPAQAETLNQMLGDFCAVYNAALESRIDAYRKGTTLTYNLQAADLKVLRAECPELARWSHTAKQHVLRRLDKAYKAFFARIKRGEKPGFPRFKARSRWDTAEFTFGDGCRLQGNRLRVVGVPGGIKIWWHRTIPEDGIINHVKLTRSAVHWYIGFSVERPDVEPRPCENPIGIDLGLEHFYATSDGETVALPKWSQDGEKRLRVLSRAVTRKKKGSRNRRKAVERLSRFHQGVAAQRRDWLHAQAKRLLSVSKHIAVEDLNIKGLARGLLAKSIHNAAWGHFLHILDYKAAEAGGRVERVNPRGTSQGCPRCGAEVRKTLSERWHACADCGYETHRDSASAQIILMRSSFWSGTLQWAPSTEVTQRLAQEAVCCS